MDIIKKLNELRLERNLSVYRLSELSGINQSTLANTFSRGTIPSIQNLMLLCDAMGITLSEFFNEDTTTVNLSEEEISLFRKFEKLPKETRKAIILLISSLADNNHN